MNYEFFILLVILVIAILLFYQRGKNRLESFYNYDYNYQHGLIEEKLNKYKYSCSKASPTVSSYKVKGDRGDYMGMLQNYINTGQEKKTQLSSEMFDRDAALDKSESDTETQLNKIKRSIDAMDLKDKANHYYFLSRLAGAEK